MISKEDEQKIRLKQKELGLSDERCNKIIEYLKFGFQFTDEEIEFEGFVLDYLDSNSKEQSNDKT